MQLNSIRKDAAYDLPSPYSTRCKAESLAAVRKGLLAERVWGLFPHRDRE